MRTKYIYIVYKLDYSDNSIPGFVPKIVDRVTSKKKEAINRKQCLEVLRIDCDMIRFEFDAVGEYVLNNVKTGDVLNGELYDEIERLQFEKTCRDNLNK